MNTLLKDVVVPYQYRVKYDSEQLNGNYGNRPYYAQYYGGWRTLWMWWTINDGYGDCLWPVLAKTFDQALGIIENHKKEYVNARRGSIVVTEEVNKK